MVYEMLFGEMPFSDEHEAITFDNISRHRETLEFPDEANVSAAGIALIRGLLTDAEQRFDYGNVRDHEFFNGVVWEDLRSESNPPPFVPEPLSDNLDRILYCIFAPTRHAITASTIV